MSESLTRFWRWSGRLAKGQRRLLMRRRWRGLELGLQLVALRNHASLGPDDVDDDLPFAR